ncbi:MAG: hypothetical protein J2P48_17175 [Alphaproteobacteria bacterium]|nr:hypothetical protein [Alphaproteobacteria bacterium]
MILRRGKTLVDLFVTAEAAHAKGCYCVEKLGCRHYTVTLDKPAEWDIHQRAPGPQLPALTGRAG